MRNKKSKRKQYLGRLGSKLAELLKTRYGSKVKGSAKKYNRKRLKRRALDD